MRGIVKLGEQDDLSAHKSKKKLTGKVTSQFVLVALNMFNYRDSS